MIPGPIPSCLSYIEEGPDLRWIEEVLRSMGISCTLKSLVATSNIAVVSLGGFGGIGEGNS
jgi:hypothetical protein